jgi:glycosyltransferase involved in cell wall biosynthesis
MRRIRCRGLHLVSRQQLTPYAAREVESLGYKGPILIEPNHRPWSVFAGLDRSVNRASLREELGIDPDAPVVGFVGHLVDQKRPLIALEVFRRLRDEVTCVVAGAGPLEEAVQLHTTARGLGHRVRLLGHRTDVVHILSGLDALVITSDNETMTGTVIEAQMAGCPVVSFDLDGISTVVSEGITGHVVPMNDTAAMAERVEQIIGCSETQRRMSVQARERAQAFSTEQAAVRYVEFLRQVVGG